MHNLQFVVQIFAQDSMSFDECQASRTRYLTNFVIRANFGANIIT